MLEGIADKPIREAVILKRQSEANAWWDGRLAENRRGKQESRVTIVTRGRSAESTRMRSRCLAVEVAA
jgi:hypothetical protein